MASATVHNIRLAGLASAVPAATATVADSARVFGEDTARKISDNTGVQTRHVASSTLCTSDLCEAAARRLLADLAWPAESIDLLLVVTQTPDYRLPATACVLHGKLGLSKSCAALDVNLGCSGYVYGLWMIGQLMQTGSFRRGLLLVGDTSTRFLSPLDRSAAPLFGDAGTVTACEFDVGAAPMHFELGTDGDGVPHLIVSAGAFRQPHSAASAVRSEREGGNIRSDDDLFMDGAEIFTFTLREVPGLMRSVLAGAAWTVEDVDAFVLHQANRFILNHLSKRMKLPAEKVPLTIESFGNTSSASIPITITEQLAGRLRGEPLKLVMAGFGVGLSWGAAALTCGPLVISDLALVAEPGV